jgi:hypothetical protein
MTPNSGIMKSRIAKKAAQRAIAQVELWYVLAHAMPSFFQLSDVGQQRRYIRQRLTAPHGRRGLAVHPNHARYVTRAWTAETAQSVRRVISSHYRVSL